MSFDHRLDNVIDEQPFPLLFITVSGAHLYGFASEDSDYDLRGIHLLDTKRVLGLQSLKETVEVSKDVDGLEIDLVTHDAGKFFRMLLKRNGYVLEQIFSPLVLRGGPVLEELRVLAKGCITRHHNHHYLGFLETQRRLFQKEAAVGAPRIKPLLYMYRVVLTGIHLNQTGEVEANLARLGEIHELSFLADLIERKVHGSEHGVMEPADLSFHETQIDRLEAILRGHRA
ncbi:MAG: nucleotidyltransferase domain-containing protein [Planctomycetota bacterium]